LKKLTLAHLIAIFWTLLILAACTIPGKDIPSINIVSIDKFAHFGIFAGFGWLWMWALRGTLISRMKRVLTAGITYAILTEIYQGFLPFERQPDPLDALANIAGLLVAMFLYHAVQKRFMA
jgi:VanZ family protein